MGFWQMFDGTNWRNPCDCPIYVVDANGEWQLVDPRNCEVRYFDGTNWCPIVCDGILIDDKTEINIWFDNSGSMNSTLAPLQDMKDNLLQACLLPIYNNDLLLYNERVRVLNMTDPSWNYLERFVKCLATERNFDRAVDTTVTNVINLTFQDESNPYGYGSAGTPFNSSVAPTTSFVNDVDDVKSALLAAQSAGYQIKGYAYRVNTGPNSYPGFRGLTEATFLNTGLYNSTNTLSIEFGLNLFKYNLDVVAGSTSTYYKDLVVAGLQEIGVLIPNCP